MPSSTFLGCLVINNIWKPTSLHVESLKLFQVCGLIIIFSSVFQHGGGELSSKVLTHSIRQVNVVFGKALYVLFKIILSFVMHGWWSVESTLLSTV